MHKHQLVLAVALAWGIALTNYSAAAEKSSVTASKEAKDSPVMTSPLPQKVVAPAGNLRVPGTGPVPETGNLLDRNAVEQHNAARAARELQQQNMQLSQPAMRHAKPSDNTLPSTLRQVTPGKVGGRGGLAPGGAAYRENAVLPGLSPSFSKLPSKLSPKLSQPAMTLPAVDRGPNANSPANTTPGPARRAGGFAPVGHAAGSREEMRPAGSAATPAAIHPQTAPPGTAAGASIGQSGKTAEMYDGKSGIKVQFNTPAGASMQQQVGGPKLGAGSALIQPDGSGAMNSKGFYAAPGTMSNSTEKMHSVYDPNSGVSARFYTELGTNPDSMNGGAKMGADGSLRNPDGSDAMNSKGFYAAPGTKVDSNEQRTNIYDPRTGVTVTFTNGSGGSYEKGEPKPDDTSDSQGESKNDDTGSGGDSSSNSESSKNDDSDTSSDDDSSADSGSDKPDDSGETTEGEEGEERENYADGAGATGSGPSGFMQATIDRKTGMQRERDGTGKDCAGHGSSRMPGSVTQPGPGGKGCVKEPVSRPTAGSGNAGAPILWTAPGGTSIKDATTDPGRDAIDSGRNVPRRTNPLDRSPVINPSPAP